MARVGHRLMIDGKKEEKEEYSCYMINIR